MKRSIMDSILAILHSADLQAKLLAALLTALVSAAYRYLRPAERVIWGTSHGFSFVIPQSAGGAGTLHTRSFSIKNEGREPASDIEIHFNFRPEHLQIWPTFNYQTEMNPEGHFCVRIANLGRQEWMSIEVVAGNRDLPQLLRVRTRQGEAKLVQIAPMRVLPRWQLFILWGLVLAGVFWLFETALLIFRLVPGA
jgi:hypothetical protein